MKRILHDVPRWHVYLHREARDMPPGAMDDGPSLRLEDELFDRLYSGECEVLPEAQQDSQYRDWAKRLHQAMDQLPAFDRLAQQCRGDAASSAAALDALLQKLDPRPPEDERAPPPPPSLRPTLNRACDAAAQAVEELHDALSGLAHVGFSWPGTRPGESSVTTEGSGTRTLASRLAQDQRLKRIALLAGRFQRILGARRRERVHHGSDEVSDVEQGANLARLLPAELARVAHPRQRLAFLKDYVEKRCLQYHLSGQEPLGKGPLVACLDKSASMKNDRDVWATAVALALLDVAQRERRPFALVCFDAGIRHLSIVSPGDTLPNDGLFVDCDGGTNIAYALTKSLDIIAERPGRLRKADIVLITDGESDATTAPEIRVRARSLGVTTLGFGIGIEPTALAAWCDEAVAVRAVDALDPTAADALARV